MISSIELSRITATIAQRTKDLTILPGAQVATTVYNAGLPEAKKIKIIDEVSNSCLHWGLFVQPLAWPSEIIGMGCGITGILVVDNLEAMEKVFKTVVDAGVRQEKDRSFKDEEDKRSNLRKYNPFAFFGAGLGFLGGIIIATAIDNWHAMRSAFNFIFYLGVSKDTLLAYQEDQPSWIRKYNPLGIFGATIGFVAGGVTVTLIDNWRAMCKAFTSLYNNGLSDEDSPLPNIADACNKSRKYNPMSNPLSLPGALLGSLGGVITIALVDNYYAVCNVFTAIFNVGLKEDHLAFDDKRARFRKWNPLGFPGAIVGFVGGIITIAVIDTWRVMRNVFTSMYNAGLKEGRIPEESKHECFREWNPLGFLGGLVGFGAGFLTVLAIDNWRAMCNAFEYAYYIGVPKENLVDKEEECEWFRKYNLLGILGGGVGFVAGAIAVVAIDNWRAMCNIFTSIYNAGLSSEDPSLFNIADESNQYRGYNPVKNFFSFPGALLGLLGGIVTASLVDNYHAMCNVFTSIYNAGLKEDLIQFEDKRKWFRKWNPFGSPGAIVGFLGGVTTVLLTDSWRAMRNVFTSMYNVGLKEGGIPEEYKHEWFREWNPLGFLGGLVGFGAGLITVTVIDNLYAICNVFTSICNVGLNGDRLPFDDKRACLRKWDPLGFPGAVVGFLGALTTVLLTDSWRAMRNVFTLIYNAGEGRVPEEYKHDWFREFNPIVFPTMLVAFLAGLVTVMVIDNWRAMCNVFTSIYDAGLKTDSPLPVEEDKRKCFRKYNPLAMPGAVLGFLGGIVTASLVDNWHAMCNVFSSIYNAGLKEGRISVEEDKRGCFRKYNPLASFGALIGAISGSITITAVDIVKSGFGLFTSIYNRGIDDESKIKTITEIDKDSRHNLRKYGPQAWPGLLVGGLIGLSISVVADNLRSSAATFTSIVNSVLSEPDKITRVSGLADDRRHPLRKYGPQVWPGIVVGGIVGTFVAGAIQMKRFVSNTVDSWRAMSGSLMNVALERPLFTGVSGDKAPGFLRGVARAVGYGTALVTTGPVGVTTYFGRKLPELLGFGLGIGFSWATGLIKLGKNFCCEEPRFPLNRTVTNEIVQKLQNLYSSLDAFGRFKTSPGSKVRSYQDGRKPISSTIRKVFTLDADTPTEKTLDAIVSAVKRDLPTDATFFESDAFNQVVQKVREEYSQDCFLSERDIKLACSEVDDVVNFIKQYMAQEVGQAMDIATDFYSKRQTTWGTLFFGPSLERRERRQSRLDDQPLLQGGTRTPSYGTT
jgi:hypothetical protein